MKISKTLLVITTLLCLFPCLVGIVMWQSLPENLPTHWNAAGQVTSSLPKAAVVFGSTAFLAVLHIVCHLVTRFEKRSKNYSKALFLFTCWIIPVLSNIMMPIIYLTASGKEIDVPRVIMPLLGILLIFVGNYLPKCKQNSTMGIKLPWTLKSEENWNKTHRLAGWLWTACGFIVLIFALINKPVLAIALIFTAVLIPVIYSYILHKKGI